MDLEIAVGSSCRKELGRLAPIPTVGPNRISEQTMAAEKRFLPRNIFSPCWTRLYHHFKSSLQGGE
jgi:hypothetical protein